MASKKITMSKLKQIIRFLSDKKPIKFIARTVGVSKNTVKGYIDSIKNSGLNHQDLMNMQDPELLEFFNKPLIIKDFDRYVLFNEQLSYYEKELKRTGVTRNLLWQEYRLNNANGYSYTQFCYHLQQYFKKADVSMIMEHLPGDKLFIDFTGKKVCYYDPYDGHQIELELLIGCLGYSKKTFMFALESQKSEDFLMGMNKILQKIGGVPKCIVPDNMKTAVTKSDKYEPNINQVFEDFGNHYQTCIVPTRALHPKDKAQVENHVKIIYSKVIAPLRNKVFTNVNEVNNAIEVQLNLLNASFFQGKDYSRNDLFENGDKPELRPLPQTCFEIKKYRSYKVQKTSHIFLSEDKHYYSVPYAYNKLDVQVIYTKNIVSIYYKNLLIAEHQRVRNSFGYSTVSDHMPSAHRDYKDRSPDYYRSKLEKYGQVAVDVINQVLLKKKHPEQNYKSCDGILQLARITPIEIFQNACSLAVLADSFSYLFIKKVITNGAAKNFIPPSDPKQNPTHENIRGKSFFNQLFTIFL